MIVLWCPRLLYLIGLTSQFHKIDRLYTMARRSAASSSAATPAPSNPPPQEAAAEPAPAAAAPPPPPPVARRRNNVAGPTSALTSFLRVSLANSPIAVILQTAKRSMSYARNTAFKLQSVVQAGVLLNNLQLNLPLLDLRKQGHRLLKLKQVRRTRGARKMRRVGASPPLSLREGVRGRNRAEEGSTM
jgi:hypothetical protein